MAQEIIGLDDWWQTPPGQHLLAWEQGQFELALADVFGYNALQLGVPQLDALVGNRMPHRWMAVTHATALADLDQAGQMPARPCVLACDPAALPFPAASLDLVVLPHTLELSADPHAAVREVERVLRPEGRVVISGLNPLSLWALRQQRAHLCERLGFTRWGASRLYLPRSGEFIGFWRLRDWLRLMGFEVELLRFGLYQPAVRTAPWLQRLAWMDRVGARWWPVLGAVYFMVATKRVKGMRLLGPAWKPYRSPVAAPVSLAGQVMSPPAPRRRAPDDNARFPQSGAPPRPEP
jgi:SAM-dependent methyltransferase